MKGAPPCAAHEITFTMLPRNRRRVRRHVPRRRLRDEKGRAHVDGHLTIKARRRFRKQVAPVRGGGAVDHARDEVRLAQQCRRARNDGQKPLPRRSDPPREIPLDSFCCYFYSFPGAFERPGSLFRENAPPAPIPQLRFAGAFGPRPGPTLAFRP